MNLRSKKWLSSISVLAFAGALLLAANCAHGQAFASITGRALDPGGASVPEATVTATNTETGIVRTTKTTSEGLYRFDNLAPGIYNVVNNEMAMEVLRDKMGNANSTKAQWLVTANPGCMLQLEAGVRIHGNGQRVLHVVEVLDQAYSAHAKHD